MKTKAAVRRATTREPFTIIVPNGSAGSAPRPANRCDEDCTGGWLARSVPSRPELGSAGHRSQRLGSAQ
jgi:hypothetical protein